jgi:hypothetical protein
MTQIIRTIDTIDFERDKSENTAQHEGVLVGWRGQWVKLDLSHDHYTEYDQLLGHLMKIGDPVREGSVSSRPRGKREKKNDRRPKTYYDGLIRWADENRITKKDGSGRPAYTGTIEGRNDYPEWLIKDYDRFLETGELPGYVQAA